MAKKRSTLKSYLMMAKYHSAGSSSSSGSKKKDKRETESRVATTEQQIGRDNFGAQTSDERTTVAVANESSLHASNSIAGDSSSGYQSHLNGGVANQFYPAARYHPQQQHNQDRHHKGSASERLAVANSSMKLKQRLMVNGGGGGGGISCSSGAADRMWPVMIDDELGSQANENPSQHQHIGAYNKVHLIDDGDGDAAEADAIDADDADDAIDVDVDIDSYDIDCVAAAADHNSIGADRFHRHRYCVDSKSSLASRFDESFQLERQRHLQQQQRQQQQHQNQVAAASVNHQQQYFHHQQPLSLQSSQFQPLHHQHQQHLSLLNGAGPLSAVSGHQQHQQQQQQTQKRFVNYIRQPEEIFGGLQYPIPPTNYSQQQYHTLVQYHPIDHQQQQQPYSYTATSSKQLHHQSSGSTESSGIETSDASNYHQNRYITYNSQQQQQQPQSQVSSLLSPSGTNREFIMQPASSRQYLTAVDSHQHQHHQQQEQQQQSSHHKSGSSRRNHRVQSSSAGQQQQQARGGKQATSGQQHHAKNKPTLDCCGKLAKFCLFATNLLFWSAGIALGAWGILCLVEDHKYNLSQLLIFDPSSRMSLFQLLSWSFITLGCATILVGFCGCSAIFKNNRWILGLYIFLVLAIFALDLATGLLAIIFQEKLMANVRLRLANKLRADYGVQASFTAAIDYIQTKFECCGLEGHFDYDQSVWRLQRLGGFEATVARTCCHLRNSFDDQAHINPRPVNESMCQSTDVRFHQSYRYRKGCLDDLERLVRHKIWTFTLGCAAVGGVILISLMFATCFCRSIQSYNGSRKESPSSSAGGGVSSSSPKHLDKSPAGRHFAHSAGHPVASQRYHHSHK